VQRCTEAASTLAEIPAFAGMTDWL